MEGKAVKNMMLLSVIGLLISCGCTGKEEIKEMPTTTQETPDTTITAYATTSSTLAPIEQEGGYTGYMPQEPGQWVEYELNTGMGSMHQRIACIGTENMEGAQARGYEVRTTSDKPEDNTLIQLWIDDAVKVVRYAIINEGNVTCMDAQIDVRGLFAMGATGTPKEFSPDSRPALEEYTTPTGKKIKAARYATSDAETLVSSVVPFGLVKSVNKKTGTVVLSLYDYGTTGAERTITREQISGCKRIV